jgi:hypothetical protein
VALGLSSLGTRGDLRLRHRHFPRATCKLLAVFGLDRKNKPECERCRLKKALTQLLDSIRGPRASPCLNRSPRCGRGCEGSTVVCGAANRNASRQPLSYDEARHPPHKLSSFSFLGHDCDSVTRETGAGPAGAVSDLRIKG